MTAPALPRPATVTARAIQIVAVEGDRVTLILDCSAGFYVRSLAHDLGERLGVGGHLVTLRRTRSGAFSLADAIALDAAERDPEQAARRVIPLAGMLLGLSPVVLTPDGVQKAIHGRDLVADDVEEGARGVRPLLEDVQQRGACRSFVRLLDPAGDLIGIAGPGPRPGLLHPSVVLV